MKAIALAAQVLIATSAMVVVALPTTSLAQDNRGAYDVAVRCFVANVHAEGLRREAGQSSVADQYRAAGRQSFDAAVALGTALGKSRSEMEADIHRGQTQYLPRMVRDADYFRTVVTTCRAYGLMPTA